MSHPSITGVVLAGGRSSRMGGSDKGLICVAGRPLVEHVITSLRPQVDCLLISANRNLRRYEAYGFPVIEDETDSYQGPLAGIASAMRLAKTDYILTVPCDSPLLPCALAERMLSMLVQGDAKACTVHDGLHIQPVFSLLSVDLAQNLFDYLDAGERGVGGWLAGQRLALADFSDRPFAFLNINTPHERRALERRINLAANHVE